MGYPKSCIFILESEVITSEMCDSFTGLTPTTKCKAVCELKQFNLFGKTVAGSGEIHLRFSRRIKSHSESLALADVLVTVVAAFLSLFLKCDHSIDSYQAVLCYVMQMKLKLSIFGKKRFKQDTPYPCGLCGLYM